MTWLLNVSIDKNTYDIVNYFKANKINVNDPSIFRVLSTPFHSGRDAKHTIEDSGEYFCSGGSGFTPWIQYDFVNSKFKVEGYSISTTYGSYLKSFKVEGFDNRNHMGLIDSHPDLKDTIRDKETYFDPQFKIGPKRIIRFTMTDVNGSGDLAFCAYRIKLFGKFFPNLAYNKVTCKRRYYSSLSNYCLYVLIIFCK